MNRVLRSHRAERLPRQRAAVLIRLVEYPVRHAVLRPTQVLLVQRGPGPTLDFRQDNRQAGMSPPSLGPLIILSGT